MENLKSIRIMLDFADENGNRTMKEQTVKVNTPSLKDKSKFSFFSHMKTVYTLSFTIQIPEFIHSYLVDKSVPSNKRGEMKNYDKEKFAKSINRTSIEVLTEAWCEIIEDYVWLKKMDNMDLKKVIFYEFDNENIKYESGWNGTEFGEKSEIKYKYSIGYISEYEKKEIRYNSKKISISSSSDREFYSHKYIQWTEEREMLFTGIQKTFETIIENINKFDTNITEKTIDSLISKNPLLTN